ncbi:hypothetical protein SLE2022_031390 [Rubroshorea leprosula]
MDPSYHHHQHHPRYVPYSPSVQHTADLYASRHHNHHHHLAPPPPQPQHHQSYHTLPAPPPPRPPQHHPYHSHHAQLTYSSNFNPNPNSTHQFRELPSHRHLFEKERTHRVPDVDTRADFWANNRGPRQHPVATLDRESHYHQFNRRPVSPIDSFRHDLEGSSRFRNEYDGDRFEETQKAEDFVWVHGDRQGPDRSSRDFGIVSKGFELNSVSVDNRYESAYDHEVISRGMPDGVAENVRWGQDRQGLRDLHLRDELIEVGNSDVGNRDEPRIFFRKLEYHESEVERYTDRGSGDNSREFNHTPRKQIQKRSAFLRIQMAKPNYRSREDERSHYMSHSSEVKLGSFRGKDQLAHLDHGMEEEGREESEVELDVSFKSNSLVAKAIVVSSSSPRVTDSSLTPRASKIRKAMPSNKDRSSSPLTKVNDGSVKVDDSTHNSNNNAPTSEDLKQSEAKGASGIFDVQDTARKSCSNGTNASPRKSKVDKFPKVATKHGGSSNVVSNASTFDKDPKHSEGKAKSSGTGNLKDSVLQSSSGRLNVLLAEKKVDTSHKSISPGKDDANACRPPPVKAAKRKKIVKKLVPKKANVSANSPSATSLCDKGVSPSKKKLPPADAKLGHYVYLQHCPMADKHVSPLKKELPPADAQLEYGVDPQCCPVFDKCVSPLKKEVPSVDVSLVHSVDLQHCPKGANLHPDNERMDGALKGKAMEKVFTAVKPDGSSANKINKKRKSLSPPFSSSGQEETKFDEISVNAVNSSHGLQTISNTKEDSIKSVNETTSGLLSSEESKVHESVTDTNNSINEIARSIDFDSSLANSLDLNIVFGSGTVDAGVEHSSANLTSPFVKKGNIEGIPTANFSTGSCEMPLLPLSDDSGIPISPVYVDCSNHHGVFISNPDRDFTNLGGSKHDIGDEFGNYLSPQGVTVSDENGHMDRSPNPIPSVGREEDMPGVLKPGAEISHENGGTGGSSSAMPSVGREEDMADVLESGVEISLENGGTGGSPNAIPLVVREKDIPDVLNDAKTGIEESDISHSACTCIVIAPADLVNSANYVDPTFTLSVKVPNPPDTTDVGCVDIGLQHCVNEISVVHESGSRDTLSEARILVKNSLDVNPDVCSKENKKQNVSSSSSSLTEYVIREGLKVAELSSPDVQLPANSDDNLLQSEEELTVSSMDALLTSGLPLSSESTILLNNLADESSPAVGLDRDAFRNDSATVDHLGVYSYSTFVESAAASPLLLCPPGTGCHQLSSVMPVTAVHSDPMDIDGDNKENAIVESAREQTLIFHKAAQFRTPPENQSSEFDQRFLSTDAEDYDSYPFVQEDLPAGTNSSVIVADGNRVPTTSTKNGLIPVPGMLSVLGSPEICNTSIICPLSGIPSESKKSIEKICSRDENNLDENTVIEGDSSYPHNSESNLNATDAMDTDPSVTGKSGVLPSEDSKIRAHVQNPTREAHGSKNQLNHARPSNHLGHSSVVFTALKTMVSSASQTWHRPGNSASLPGNKPSLSTVPSQRQTPDKVPKLLATSYIRKGNSLVRNSASQESSYTLSSSVYQLSTSGVDEMKKGTGADSRADGIDSSNLLPAGLNAAFERPRTPPLPSLTKALNHSGNTLGKCTSSSLAEPPLSNCCEPRDYTASLETNDLLDLSEDGLKDSETQNENSSVINLDGQTEQNDGNLVSSNVKRITYVKPKSNQLVATSDHCNTLIHNSGKDQTFIFSNDGYYKRSKNQLIRTALESQNKQTVTIPDEKSNSARQAAPKVISGRTFSKRQSQKVAAKNYKPSQLSLVWTLHSGWLSNNYVDSLHRPKFFPQVFPWKRVTYWRSFTINSVSCHNSPISLISQKLLLSRKRNTIYTRSINGFSLRKSKVLSVGCPSLKWSKSIESHSKKASEEATLAVAAAGRKKRELSGIGCSLSGADNKVNFSNKSVHGTELRPGEHIFCIGSVHYKMDSSRQTLQRISGDESSCSAGSLLENNIKKSFVPRRLIIGNDEYVRIGNGNQLVRNPKKRTRVLASEKVRWSLHTARLRLSKKRKYCQFFTRFGKCNKDGGKCPFIHDSSKIAVCTKFLKGLCSNPDCKLTHKVIPERMPDCAYFLQGLCTNEECPYRHVHVNPNASTCEGFLRGYCADGNECRKKHSYVCPIFEAKGSCSQGSKCKLHHPKKWSRSKKSKRSREHKSAHGRYFGSMHVDISEPGRVVGERQPRVDDNLCEGQFSDYIGLDVSDEEAKETNDTMSDQPTFGDDDPWDSQTDDLEELIKPIGIMNRNLTI